MQQLDDQVQRLKGRLSDGGLLGQTKRRAVKQDGYGQREDDGH
jgi:hypothetical protein